MMLGMTKAGPVDPIVARDSGLESSQQPFSGRERHQPGKTNVCFAEEAVIIRQWAPVWRGVAWSWPNLPSTYLPSR